MVNDYMKAKERLAGFKKETVLDQVKNASTNFFWTIVCVGIFYMCMFELTNEVIVC